MRRIQAYGKECLQDDVWSSVSSMSELQDWGFQRVCAACSERWLGSTQIREDLRRFGFRVEKELDGGIQIEDSFVHSGYFYSASSRPLLLRDAPDYSIAAVSELRAKALQVSIRVKDLPKAPTLRLEWYSNFRPTWRKAPNLPLSHHAPLKMTSWFETF